MPVSDTSVFCAYRNCSKYMENLYMCNRRLEQDEESTIRQPKIHITALLRQSYHRTTHIRYAHAAKQKNHKKSTYKCRLWMERCKGKQNMELFLTDHTHTASLAMIHGLSKRCRKLAFQKACCSNKLRSAIVIHRLTYLHPWNSLHEIHTQNQNRRRYQQIIINAVREENAVKWKNTET